MPSATVFVSGAAGFISQHNCKNLLAGGYTVVGSARSKEEGDHLVKLFSSLRFSYEIVPDLDREGAFDKALQNHPEVEFFLHTASPTTFQVLDIVLELLNPAIKGTQNALKAAQVYGKNIKHVVVTSSIVAMMNLDKQNDPSHTESEVDWCSLTYELAQKNGYFGYIGSKTLAEKAAWDFVESQKVHFTLSTVNPDFAFGPQAFDEEAKENLNASAEMINNIINLKPSDDVPSMCGGFCDVRDVSKAHIASIERASDVKGQRLMMMESKFAAQDILDIVNENFPQLKGKVPVGVPGSGKDVVAGLCKVDNSKTRAILGFKQIPFRDTIVDTVAQFLRVRE